MYCAKSADRHCLVAGGSQFLGFRPHHFLFEIRQYDCCACLGKGFRGCESHARRCSGHERHLFSKDMFMSCLELRFLIHHFRCRRLRIALADCANLLVKRAIVGRHDSSAVRRIPIQVCAEIQQSESANMTSSLFWVFTWIGTRSAVCPEAVAVHGRRSQPTNAHCLSKLPLQVFETIQWFRGEQPPVKSKPTSGNSNKYFWRSFPILFSERTVVFCPGVTCGSNLLSIDRTQFAQLHNSNDVDQVSCGAP